MTNGRMIRREDIDALLFDFGGVLGAIDFARVIARWADLSGRSHEHIRERFSHGEDYERHERAEIDIAAYCDSLRRDLGVALDDDALVDGWQQVFVGPIAPTIELLHELRGRVPMYMFSNTNATHCAFFRERYAAAFAPIERIFVSNEIGARKPERRAFERVASEIGVPPERILFFDDSAANVEGARAIGMPSVLVRTPDDVRVAVGPWLDVASPRIPG
jgi:putative hydrolase of the HAD superfamily